MRESGIEATTMRAVARRVGCSTGVLAHYFDDKAEIIDLAVQWSFETTAASLSETIAGHPPLDALARMANVALPNTGDGVLQLKTWLAYTSMADVTRGDGIGRVRDRVDGVVDLVESVVHSGQLDGTIVDTEDARSLAERLVLVIDGLSVRMTLDPERYDTSHAEVVVQAALRTLRRPSTVAEFGGD